MKESLRDGRQGKAEMKLIKDQKHLEEVWSIMEPIADEYATGYLNGILQAGEGAPPDVCFSLFLQKLIKDNDKSHDTYHDIFDEESMLEYEEDVEGFKSDILKKRCDVIRNTLKSKSEALKEWKAKFYGCKSQLLFDTFNNIVLFGQEYDSEMDEAAMDALDSIADCRLSEMEEDQCYRTGVLGYGIVSNILGHMYPRTFPGNYKAGIWSLYFLSDGTNSIVTPTETSEFSMLKDETASKTGIYEMEHNYFFPYEVFCIYSLRIYRLLTKRISETFAKEYPSDYRFLLTNNFYDYVCAENRACISTLAGNDDVLKFGTLW